MNSFKKLSLIFATLAISFSAHAVKIGAPAPEFTLKDGAGKDHSLKATLADKKPNEKVFVVLEWVNYSCPFVKKHYGSGNMQKVQSEFVGKMLGKKNDTKVVWYSINSGAPGNEGYLNPADTLKAQTEHGSKATAALLDADGKVGKAYDAKTTPHMFIIAPDGTVAYDGAMDDRPTTDQADVKPGKAKPLFENAMKAAIGGGNIELASNKPYGCSVKYKN